MKVRRVLQWRKWYKQRCGGWAVVRLGWSLGGMWEYSGEPSWKWTEARLQRPSVSVQWNYTHWACTLNAYSFWCRGYSDKQDKQDKTKSVSLWALSSSREKKTINR